jgi:HPt (histidine-containing phosphotransfer) domain-containing protein
MQSIDQGQAVYSEFGDDLDLGDIVEMFVDEMPSRTAALVESMKKQDWEGSRRLAHQLKGAAGSYGFHDVTPLAARLETALRDGASEGEIQEAAEDLLSLCDRLRSGVAPPIEPPQIYDAMS